MLHKQLYYFTANKKAVDIWLISSVYLLSIIYIQHVVRKSSHPVMQ